MPGTTPSSGGKGAWGMGGGMMGMGMGGMGMGGMGMVPMGMGMGGMGMGMGGMGMGGMMGMKRPAPWAPGAAGPVAKRMRGAVPFGAGINPGWGAGANNWWGANAWGASPWEVPSDKVVCMAHNKMRSPGSLVQAPDGSWVCRPDSQCKTAEGGADGVNTQMCATHNRVRASNYLDMGPDGQWHCRAGRECKVKSGGM